VYASVFLWMPHREIRGDVAELERRGILNPQRDEKKLFRDPRDPRDYYAGANFAWIEHDHFTVMAAEHVDQAYSAHNLEAMLNLHHQTGGRFRILFNGPGAGATIPWHLHYQITTTPMPIEELTPGQESHYPKIVHRFAANADGAKEAHTLVCDCVPGATENHSINILVTTIDDAGCLFVFPRDQRRAQATNKGLVGGFEVSGDFCLSAPNEEEGFRNASANTARGILEQIRPDF